jgi:intraflagellar transport protein 20
MDQKVKICYDKDYKVRVLDPIKFEHAIDLENECGNFVAKITDFNGKINSLVEVLETHASRIDERKLKAIGLRIASENECEQRLRKMRTFQALIAEKKAELDRYTTQCQSLERIEAEQKSLIEKMSSC